MQQGDIITKVEGAPAYESSDLQERVGRLQPGDKIHLTVLHGNEQKNVMITLKADAPTPKLAVSKSAEELYNKLGASFSPLTPAQKQKFHINNGVVITQVRQGGMFDSIDVSVGSVITSINRQHINNLSSINNREIICQSLEM